MLAKVRQARTIALPAMVDAGLRRSILNGEIRAGERLAQLAIARAFEVSQVPVREALQRLEGEGLVVSRPRRGWVVAPLSVDEVEEIYAMRLGLEMLAGRLGAERIGDKDLARMKTALEQMKTIARHGGDVIHFLAADLSFHKVHYAASGRPRLLQRILHLRLLAQRYIVHFWGQPKGLRKTLETHKTILEACITKDGRLAAATIRSDLESTATNLIATIQQTPNG